jgi:hypothetical protein
VRDEWTKKAFFFCFDGFRFVPHHCRLGVIQGAAAAHAIDGDLVRVTVLENGHGNQRKKNVTRAK